RFAASDRGVAMSVSVLGQNVPKLGWTMRGRGLRESVGWVAGLAIIGALVVLRQQLAPWVLMWLLAFTIFGTFKALTLLHLKREDLRRLSLVRLAAYLFLWPGMRPRTFFGDDTAPPVAHAPGSPTRSTNLWRAVLINLALGASLLATALWGLPESTPDLLRAW